MSAKDWDWLMSNGDSIGKHVEHQIMKRFALTSACDRVLFIIVLPIGAGPRPPFPLPWSRSSLRLAPVSR
eukprot:3440457-Pyramimonas_sp.AAC.1